MTHRQELFSSVALALVLWLFISGLVFTFRHPWLTDTQRIFHIWDAMTFQRLSEPVKDANDA
jgi:hypothetical protein